MEKLKIILNGTPESGSGNIVRAGLAVGIPVVVGLSASVHQSLTSPELGIIAPILTLLAPIGIGLVELIRQFGILDKKNAEMDKRFMEKIQQERQNIIKRYRN